MENLKELLIDELQDIYSAEKQIVKAMPKIAKGAQTQALREAFTEHLTVTKEQVLRLDEIFALLGQKPKAKHCKGMEGLLAEGTDCLEEKQPGELRDLALIGSAQRVEHYEMAAYGTARTIAEKCGLSECVALLAETLQEEEEADTKLTEVAEKIYDSVGSDDDDSDEGDDESESDAPKAANGQIRQMSQMKMMKPGTKTAAKSARR